MKLEVHLDLREYIARGDANAQRLLDGDHPLLKLVLEYDSFFANELWADADVPPIPFFLSVNAFLMWVGGVRMALSGHEAAVYPLFRTALESACYALLIVRTPSLAIIWRDREEGEAQRKASRKAFGSAVAEVAEVLGRKPEGIGAFISGLYKASIDLGAHPNTLGVMNHVQTLPGEDGLDRFGIGSLYPGDSFEVFRALAAALDYARGLSFILVHCFPLKDRRLADRITELSQQVASAGTPKPEV